MGPGDAEVVTPLSYPGWTRGRRPERGLQGDDENDRYGNEEDRPDFNNKSFLETATLSSVSGSLSRPPQPQQYEAATDRLALRAYAYAPPSANMLAQPSARPQPQRPATAYASSCRSTQYLADESFFLSRQTSAATMAMTGSSGAAANANPTDSQTTPFFTLSSFWHQEPKVELRLPSESQADEEEQTNARNQLGLLDTLDHELLFPDGQHSVSQDRPSSSRSHLRWRRTRSPELDASKNLRVSSEEPDLSDSFDSNRPSTIITRDEFEALPPKIKRKYFSTIERSQLAHQLDSDCHTQLGNAGHDQPSSSPEPPIDKTARGRQNRQAKTTSDPSTLSSGRTRINSTDQRFLANLPEKIKRQHLTEEEQIAADYRRLTLLSNPLINDITLKVIKTQPRDQTMQSPIGSPALSEGQSSLSSAPHMNEDHAPRDSEKKRVDSFYDSFRWLEEDESLDLRLYLDDYHINLREEIPVPYKNRRPSFRRHLSINKLPFGRGSISYSRPPMPTSPTVPSSGQSPVLGSEGHVRRRSRALSLMSQRLPSPESTPIIDTEASHYQDPEARKKVRAFLTSPQKFDEAIEFGFPSKDGSKPNMAKPNAESQQATSSSKFRSFLEDGQSSLSEQASVEDPESPKTPHLFNAPERPHERAFHAPTLSINERNSHVRGETSRDPLSSRDMTLRMTLTRPDLRANEEQMYGWKQSPGRARSSSAREETASPLIYARDRDENRKESVERQLASLDQWDEEPNSENGVVKRIWNRVRRS